MWTRRFGVWVRAREHGVARSVVEGTLPVILDVTPLPTEFGHSTAVAERPARGLPERESDTHEWAPAKGELLPH